MIKVFRQAVTVNHLQIMAISEAFHHLPRILFTNRNPN